MTDCHHCDNPAEVCRGCYERLRQEANDRANERLDSQYVALVRQQALTASVTERLMLAEQERDRLREQGHKQHLREVWLVSEQCRLQKRAEELEWKHTGQKKAIELLQKGFESTCEQHDALKQSSRATAAECERLRKQIEQQAAAYDKLHEAHKETVAECDRLRAQVDRLRAAARTITDACAATLSMTHLRDSDQYYGRVGSVRALAKALEETAP